MDNFNYQAYLKNNPLLKEEVKDSLITESEAKDVDEVIGVDRKGNQKPDTDISNLSKAKEAIRNMKVSDLKAKIKEDIISLLQEADEEVNVDVEGDNIDVEDKGVDATVKVGLSPEEEIIQDSLKAAMDAANALGNQKLSDQIGNTITFFTREYVVKRNND